ncbi:MAG: hypothetical protein PVG91_01400 [Gammaproteobacteria bacterium]
MFGPILPLLAQIPGSLWRWLRGDRARHKLSARIPEGVPGINTLVTRRILDLGPDDDITTIISRLDANAERNRNRIALQWSSLSPGEHPPPELLFRPIVLEMVDPEILGVLLSFAHPNDLDRIFERLVELRYDPAAVARAAASLAGAFLERGLDAVGKPLHEAPFAGGRLDQMLGPVCEDPDRTID